LRKKNKRFKTIQKKKGLYHKDEALPVLKFKKCP